MIKAAGRTGDGKPWAFFGLDGEDITRLVADEPIYVKAAQMTELGLPAVEVVIHYGKTPAALLDEIAAHEVKIR